LFRKIKSNHLLVILGATCIILLSGSLAMADDATNAPKQEPTQEQNPTPTPTPETAQTPPDASATPSQTVIYALPPGATLPAQQVEKKETDPLVLLRKKPKKLHAVSGKTPPEGYVEVEQRRRKMIIAGSSIFGGVYGFCLLLAGEDNRLIIPFAGPIIAGFSYKSSLPKNNDDHDNPEVYARMWGILGSVAQVTGVTLFIMGLASKKKVWLRQDLAGLKIQFAPTVVGKKSPGLGVVGTF